MNEIKMTNLERVNYKRRRRRKKRKRIFTLFLIIILILCGSIFYIKYKDGDAERKVAGFADIAVPDYVDVQLIDVGLARTGVKLVDINNIVIHYTGNPGTTAQNNRDYFAKPDTDVCSHFVIGLDGEIIQCVPLNEKSAASNNRNLDTISIEVCHPDSSGKFKEDTYNSLVKLTAWLCDVASLKSDDVIRHYDITGKECPKYFVDNESAWNTFLSDVKQELKNY